MDDARLWWDHLKKNEKIDQENLEWSVFKKHFEEVSRGDVFQGKGR